MKLFELGRLDGWYERLQNSVYKTNQEYLRGYSAGAQHKAERLAWTRAHVGQSQKLDHENG